MKSFEMNTKNDYDLSGTAEVWICYISAAPVQYKVLLAYQPAVVRSEPVCFNFIPDIRLHSQRVFGSKQKVNAPPWWLFALARLSWGFWLCKAISSSLF
jgi:hypothetical protein